ncbi:ead/Ea22-like family protein [Pseudomonas sp.]|uniref:ead/Ea22-like family protein n=1 Tax=Pseudomonas sp. TaxID=306 RepID=UPI00289DC89E|nr:ead/Ea22-like family protein [Pseudomonas sp.]
MNIDIDGLIELAKKATPGPWLIDGNLVYALSESGADVFWLGVNPGYKSKDERTSLDEILANIQHIAAANPATVLALCERLREAEKTIANALSELKAGDVRSAIDQLEAGNE